VPSPSFLQPGLTLADGRYRVELRLARGGLGEVWRGSDALTGRPVVFKTMRFDRADDTGAVLLFLNEARHGATVDHPNVVQTLGRLEGEVPPPGVIIQEWAQGHSLAHTIAVSGPLETKRALRIMAKVARALRAVHTAELVHRDVSTLNIIIDQADQPKLIDFGIAVPIGAPSVTRHLTVPGNPDYLAPELARGRPATPAADLYSLGIVLFETLTGAKPYVGSTREDTATAHVLSPPPLPPAGLPSDLRSFISLLVAKDPMRRPQNALAVARMFEAWST